MSAASSLCRRGADRVQTLCRWGPRGTRRAVSAHRFSADALPRAGLPATITVEQAEWENREQPGFDEKRLISNEWIDETTNALGRPAGKVGV